MHVDEISESEPLQEQQVAKAKRRRKNRLILIGILSSIAVLIASVGWVSIRLVADEGLKNPDNKYDDEILDWRSMPGDDHHYESSMNDDAPFLPDVERDDVLLDDEYYEDYIPPNIRTIPYEQKKAKTAIDLNIILSCPSPGGPVTIDFPNAISFNTIGKYHRVLLENSSPGILCTLMEVSDNMVDGDVQLKPIGRSYNGHGWEPYRGPYYGTTDVIPLSCSESSDENISGDCIIVLPPLPADRKYVLKSYAYSLSERDEAARFLERTTFGATTSEINAFVNDGNDYVDWIRTQLKLRVSSHRQFFRERANNYHAETTWMGTHAFGPCQRGAQYRRFVFVTKDIERYLTISSSPIDERYKVLSIGGHVRSVIGGVVQRYIGASDKPIVPDGSYEICSIAREPSVGRRVSLRFDSECNDVLFNGTYGNPTVTLDDQHLHLVNSLVTIENQYTLPAMTEFYAGNVQFKELVSDIINGECVETTAGAPEIVALASIGGSYWIYTPSFRLKNNRLHAPLPDGGKSAVTETANAPDERMRVYCSNAPRTFLNEDHCVLSQDACSSKGNPQTSRPIIVCGSPYEVANKHSPKTGILGSGSFDVLTQYNRTSPQETLEKQRETVWLETALMGEDQLRQRVAWALSQVLVVSPNSIQQVFHTESFLVYYDIFVRNAFGNYFDILKEVTYSPMMAEMLTYNNGWSTGFAWTRLNKTHHADENYARELLQLFSIGLYELNEDGTIRIDKAGHEVRSYKNHDISEYAKVFVGFRNQAKRGNIEEVTRPEFIRNGIDPLQIIPNNKDLFPKLGMDRRYVGDGYPLCKDLPTLQFLKKGATFRSLGSNPNPDLLNDPDEWSGSSPMRISIEKTSILASKLCETNEEGNCEPSMKVVLDSDIECSGVECTLEELRTFEIGEGSGVWFEYVRPPCVNHAFYDRAQTIRRRWGTFGRAMCGDPETLAASTVCCDNSDPSHKSFRKELFAGERVPLDLAQQRCSLSTTNRTLCKNPVLTDCVENGGCDNLGTFFWSSSSCFLTAKINQQGKVAVVHNPQIEGVETDRMVMDDTIMFFRVDWLTEEADSLIHSLVNDCEGFGCTSGDGNTCICPVSTHETLAFDSDEELMAHSVDAILVSATVGSFFQSEEYFQPMNGVEGVSKYPDGQLTENTIFKVVDSHGQTHYRKNTKYQVHLGNELSFRNPVTFYTLSEPTIRDAGYEIDATLHHAFFHRNTGPFFAIRLAQRFGESNPPPRYVKVISTSFRSGIYTDASTGTKFGSGRYGCLEATIAALLLDREVIDPILDADPTHGAIQEPYLKFVKILRSLEFKAPKGRPLLTVQSNLQELIGQQSHKLPSVFSFFKSEYQPAGRISSAGMSSPESQVLSGRTSVQLTNILFSYLKYGASSCFGGFGAPQPGACMIGATTSNNGESAFDAGKSDWTTSTDIIEHLATLLTSGRLDAKKREIVKDAYDETIANGKTSKEAIINAQQLIVASPEFHATNLGQTIGQSRSSSLFPGPKSHPYKAVVFIMLPGGYDSFNVLVPKTCNATNPDGKTVYDQYLEQRGSVAFDEMAGELKLVIDAKESNQPCSEFAIHDGLTIVKELYDDSNLAFIANAGIINNQGMTKSNYHSLTRSQLFAHNAMQYETGKLDPYDKVAGTGVLGRAKDVLSKTGFAVSTISLDNPSISIEGTHGKSPPVTVVGRRGFQKFATRPKTETYFDIEKYTRRLNAKVDEFSGIFGDLFSQQIIKGMDEGEAYQSVLDQARLDESIWKSNERKDDLEQEHWDKWSTIAKLIQKKDLRNVDRDIFFTEIGSWDHHNKMKDGLRQQLRALNDNLRKFVQDAKTGGYWNDVAVVVSSDFGRTLTPNSNDGTDHGWGGHYMILGGDVQGGQILGEYPSDLTQSGPLVDDRGRIIPTTSWDSIWNGVLEWTGVTDPEDLDYCLPNRFNTVTPVEGAGDFPLLTASSMFRLPSALNLRGRKE